MKQVRSANILNKLENIPSRSNRRHAKFARIKYLFASKKPKSFFSCRGLTNGGLDQLNLNIVWL
jgi:hypothetical protein